MVHGVVRPIITQPLLFPPCYNFCGLNLVLLTACILTTNLQIAIVVIGLREIGVSYCVHNVTTAVLPSTSSMETLCSGHFIYTIGHTYFPKSLDNQLKQGKTNINVSAQFVMNYVFVNLCK